MSALLSKAGRAALRAVLPALVVLGLGLLNAKDLQDLKLQATVGILALLTATIAAVQAFVPQLSFRGYLDDKYAKYLDAALQAGLGTLLALATGLFAAPETALDKAAWTAALVAAGTAAIRAVQALLTPGETPAPAAGLEVKNP